MAVNRITGLATGMDTDALIEQLMSASRAPLTKLEQNNTKVEWQREALLDINSKLLSFRTAALDMKLQGTYKSYSANSSNSNLVTASATTEAEEGVYTFKVTRLATKTHIEGSTMPEMVASQEFRARDINMAGKEFYVTYNGEKKKISFGETETYMNGAALAEALDDKIRDAFGESQIKVTADTVAGYTTLMFESESLLNLPVTLTAADDKDKDFLKEVGIESGSTSSFSLSSQLDSIMDESAFDGDGNFTISVRDKEFTFNRNQTVSDVLSEINKDVDLDVTARYNSVEKKFTFERSTTGDGKELKIGGNENFWSAIGMSTADSAVSGQNAQFDITTPDGQKVEGVQMATNSFTYKGVTATLLNVDPNETVTVTVSKNVDEVYGKIETFVNSYNDLLTTLNKAYNEEKTGYDPLTQEERDSLSETQEEQWEEMAKKGILRRDSTIKNAISELRAAVTSSVAGSDISSLFQIGISTNQYDPVNSENNGKLIIDKDKLKEAITNNIDGVTSLFTNTAKQIQGNKLEDSNLDLDGKSFTVTLGGSTKTISLSGSYDLSSSSGISDFENYMKDQFANAFGEGRVSITYSGGKLLFNSVKNINMTFESGDALAEFGIAEGTKFDTNERGFAVKIYDICTSSMNSIIDKAGSSATTLDASLLGSKMKEIKESITKQQEKLERLEERYYAQFAAMEEAINNMNSQSSYLESMLNGG